MTQKIPLGFRGAALPLADIDLPQIGALIGVGEDELHAVLDAETLGSGFDRAGRPKMLFEPHVFWAEIDPPLRARAADLGLAYPKWRPGAYPPDSYPRLAQALDLDRDAALRSCSWGLGQVMGFNCRLAGFATAEAMVTAFCQCEVAQLAGMVEFIRQAGLDDELRRHDWRGFARGYNGPGFEKNGYDRKLAAAYARWANIPDTPLPAAGPQRVPPRTAAPAQKTGGLLGIISKLIGG